MAKAINVNETVRVKLTETGLRRHRDDHNEFLAALAPAMRRKFAYLPPTIDEDGYSRFQLHDLFNTFGPAMLLGREPPFIELVMDDSKLKDHP